MRRGFRGLVYVSACWILLSSDKDISEHILTETNTRTKINPTSLDEKCSNDLFLLNVFSQNK